jgi:8-oxo-dGTP diphosphatase|tara:strand:+ start:122 stop:499 length:378 start_codon:yes stop_codon:yes gene_type:complete
MEPQDVVAAIIRKDGLYLIAQRNRDKYMGLRWEFPGGKVEPGESFREALSREIMEELNIVIDVHEKLAQERYNDDRINVSLHYYLCTQKSGATRLNEHESIAWVAKKDFGRYDFVEGDGNVLSLL